jgi:hypothetical protein
MARARHVIDEKPQPRMLRSDPGHDLAAIRHQQAHRNTRALRGRPQPVGRAVDQPVLLARFQECEAQSQHAGLLLPRLHERAVLRLAHVEEADDRQPIGMLAGRFERNLVGPRIPARRMQQHARHTGLVHVPQQFILRVARDLPVDAHRCAAFPDVNLRVDDQQSPLLHK